METEDRYERNLGVFTAAELRLVRRSRVCVVGCGGLGGYVCNSLARFGVGSLTLLDGDSFSEGNLNRQLFATAQTLGENKAIAAKRTLADINEEISVAAYPVMLTRENAAGLLADCDLAMDCLDSVPARRLLADACSQSGIPLVHGAVSGLYGQVACLYPQDRLFDWLYPEFVRKRVSLGNPVFAPQLVAAIQSCEAVKILSGQGTALRGTVLYIDLKDCRFETVHLCKDRA